MTLGDVTPPLTTPMRGTGLFFCQPSSDYNISSRSKRFRGMQLLFYLVKFMLLFVPPFFIGIISLVTTDFREFQLNLVSGS